MRDNYAAHDHDDGGEQPRPQRRRRPRAVKQLDDDERATSGTMLPRSTMPMHMHCDDVHGYGHIGPTPTADPHRHPSPIGAATTTVSTHAALGGRPRRATTGTRRTTGHHRDIQLRRRRKRGWCRGGGIATTALLILMLAAGVALLTNGAAAEDGGGATSTTAPSAAPPHSPSTQIPSSNAGTAPPSTPPPTPPPSSPPTTPAPLPIATTAPPSPAPTTSEPTTAAPVATGPKQPFDTEVPTRTPSARPTSAPTATATTDRPSPRPTDRPTPRPSLGPTEGPTHRPTPTPTKRPTLTPTQRPTEGPTKIPTSAPTKSPTFRPTQKPTEGPTKNPTSAPTKRPTPSPTPNPTTPSPTESPSSSPSLSHAPSDAPSFSPTDEPSSIPSVAPSRPEQEDTIYNIIMTFDDCQPLGTTSVDVWEELTSKHIQEEFDTAVNAEYGLYDVDVEAHFVDQRVPRPQVLQTFSSGGSSVSSAAASSGAQQRSGGGNAAAYQNDSDRRRDLQIQTTPSSAATAGKSPLRIRFDVVVMFRSANYTHDVVKYVSSSLNQIEDRINYISSLQSSDDDSFNGINTVSVEIYGIDIFVPDPPTPAPSSGGGGGFVANIGLIVGCAVGGAFVAALFGFAVYKASIRRQRARRAKSLEKDFPDTPPHDLEGDGPGDDGVNRFIEVENGMDDVSTLGDPVGFHFAQAAVRDDQTVERDETVGESTLHCDYDYSKYYRGSGGNDDAPIQPATTPDRAQCSNRSLGSANSGTPSSTSSPSNAPETDGAHRSPSKQLATVDQGPSLVFSDDDSFEEQFSDPEERFEVDCPPGKLGVVIDTALGGGVPAVHQIKDTSVLIDRVQVGDVLVSVDGVDTTCMTALQVSDLISSKNENSSRILVFVRNLKS